MTGEEKQLLLALEYMQKEPEELVDHLIAILVALGRKGLVATVQTIPTWPPAMGNYRLGVDLRAARHPLKEKS